MDHEVEITKAAKRRSLERRVKDLHTYFEPPKRNARPSRYNCDSMNEDLEYLYDVLIRPIAEHLVNMKPEHKLILAPTEVRNVSQPCSVVKLLLSLRFGET